MIFCEFAIDGGSHLVKLKVKAALRKRLDNSSEEETKMAKKKKMAKKATKKKATKKAARKKK